MYYKQLEYSFYFNYLSQVVNQHLGRAHGPPFGPILAQKLSWPKRLDRGPEHSWPIHKPPRLELSLARRRVFLVLATDKTLSQRVGEARLPKRFLMRHCTTLNLECPRGTRIDDEEALPLHLLLQIIKNPFLLPNLLHNPSYSHNFSYSKSFLLTVELSPTSIAPGIFLH